MLKTAIALLAMTGSAHALDYWNTGNRLHQQCSGSGRALVGAYAIAVEDTDTQGGHVKRDYCTPDGIVMGQVIDVVCTYLQNTPEKRHYVGPILVREALTKAWPCPWKKYQH
ncbi:Rap1a/Tai family immunity protein [Terrihabitans rhizophilus]|uniref:Rap1a/Tai family immunity protein n=1 Tax=Terrihabitans rhizophilus TaxID=3092662 RepID=A0ABU4RU48_9HYPH|nr:Rap1a/Tai family immunity protein [Terrihabitans sp. PJ23]MDX6807150.1 Rap1a/Tai family immunity protein [Terrihabitans sp. PJ23]